MTTEYRAVVTCTGDPCPYCRAPKRSRVLDHPAGPFASTGAATKYGRGMANNVYGASVHSVSVEQREVGEWQAIT